MSSFDLTSPPRLSCLTPPLNPVVRMGGSRGPPSERLDIRLPENDMAAFLEFIEEFECSRSAAVVYLIRFDRLYRQRIKDLECAKPIRKEKEDEESDAKLKLCLNTRQWDRYRAYCRQSSSRSFDRECHEQRLEELLDIAEKYKELVHLNQSESSKGVYASEMAVEPKMGTRTPDRRSNSSSLPPTTPRKQAPSDRGRSMHPNASTTAKLKARLRDAIDMPALEPEETSAWKALERGSEISRRVGRSKCPQPKEELSFFARIMGTDMLSERSASSNGQSSIRDTRETNLKTDGQKRSKDTGTPKLRSSSATTTQTLKLPRANDEDGLSDNDSDNSWEDGARPSKSKARKPRPRAKKATKDDQDEEGEGTGVEDRSSYTVTPKDSEVPQLQLLESGYYTKFSEDARRTIPEGSKRTLAALANTRRHIVDRRQLKKLIACCACTTSGCCAKIDPKTIKLTESGPTVIVKAFCLSRKGHQFQWATSTLIKHESNANSTFHSLNIMLPAAIYLSGNNVAKMEQFAKVLRLSWGSRCATDRLDHIVRPVVHRCFQSTQTEMLTTLSKESETSRIILAGDGQFDSPGSCATMCTYTLMALGVETEAESQQNNSDDGPDKEKGGRMLKKCGYILNQAVIDKRHADSKSGNMERVGMHWAMQPIREAGLKVSEFVTDDHVQIVADFKKIAAAVEEQKSAADNTALDAFKTSLSTALVHYKPKIDVQEDIEKLMSFYGPIAHTNDIWHKAKNLLKAVSLIANSAPAKEQQTYRRYAKMIKNYLWECSKKAKGNAEQFKDTWDILSQHLQDNHANCHEIDMHSKTKSMTKLDNTTKAFEKLIKCLDKVTASAHQVCQFRSTSNLEVYNGLCLKYCPKRVWLTYDTLQCKRELATLDHNHHLLRAYRMGDDGKYMTTSHWKKSTKAYSLNFRKENKDYAYIPHLMAAILHTRYQHIGDLWNAKAPMSAMHPKRIQLSTVPNELRQTTKQTCAKYMARDPTRMRKVTKPSPHPERRENSNTSSRKRKGEDSSDDDEEWVPTKRTRSTKPKRQPLDVEEEEEHSASLEPVRAAPQAQIWREKSNSNAIAPTRSKKRKGDESSDDDEDWVPNKRTRATKPKRQSIVSEEDEPESPEPARKERRRRASRKMTHKEKYPICLSPVIVLDRLDLTELGIHQSDASDAEDDGDQGNQDIAVASTGALAGASAQVTVQESSIEASIATSDISNSNTVTIAVSLDVISDEAGPSHHHQQEVLEEPPHSSNLTDAMNAQDNDPNPGGSFWMEDDSDLLFSIGQALADPCVSQVLRDPRE